MNGPFEERTEERERRVRTLVILAAVVVLAILMLLLFGPAVAPEVPDRGERPSFRGGYERVPVSIEVSTGERTDADQEIRATPFDGGAM